MDTVEQLAMRLLDAYSRASISRSQFMERRQPLQVVENLHQQVARYRSRLAALGDPPQFGGEAVLFVAQLVHDEQDERLHLQQAIDGAMSYVSAIEHALRFVGESIDFGP